MSPAAGRISTMIVLPPINPTLCAVSVTVLAK
jgi:hypothetical protein